MEIRKDSMRVQEATPFSGKCAAPAPKAASGANSQVKVSGGARELSALARTVDKSSEVRTDKVADLKARVDSGTYKVDLEGLASLLADKL